MEMVLKARLLIGQQKQFEDAPSWALGSCDEIFFPQVFDILYSIDLLIVKVIGR